MFRSFAVQFEELPGLSSRVLPLDVEDKDEGHDVDAVDGHEVHDDDDRYDEEHFDGDYAGGDTDRVPSSRRC